MNGAWKESYFCVSVHGSDLRLFTNIVGFRQVPKETTSSSSLPDFSLSKLRDWSSVGAWALKPC